MSYKNKVVRLKSCFSEGMVATCVDIDVTITPGIPTFDVIGLCDSSIRESKWRIRSAINSSGLKMPQGHITISISPAYMHKSGTAFDLPMAIGILIASNQISIRSGIEIYAEGELSLTGEIKQTPGAMIRLREASLGKYDYVIFPEEENRYAEIIGIKGIAFANLGILIRAFKENSVSTMTYASGELVESPCDELDFSLLKGQEKAKRSLLLAAAGKHNILLLGSPGCGKTMAGRLISSILPVMTNDELTDVFCLLNCCSGEENLGSVGRPFRHIVPTTSVVSLLGSSRTMLPGEIAKANHGVLFADEICEYKNEVLDALRVPLESREVRLTKDGVTYVYPSSFIFVGAGNPCKCGMLFEEGSKCRCTRQMRNRYMSKLSGPLLDRIDLFAEMRSISKKDMAAFGESNNENLALRAKVNSAWQRQRERYGCIGNHLFNGTINTDAGMELMRASKEVINEASRISEQHGYSGRGFTRVIKVARTIADVADRDDISVSDVYEAAIYRNNTKDK